MQRLAYKFAMRLVRLTALTMMLAQTLGAQGPPDVAVDAAERSAVIDGALNTLTDFYVFPAVAQQMASAIRARQQRGDYDTITSGRQFANALTDHLREVSRDLHLTISLVPSAPPPPAAPPGEPLTLDQYQRTIGGRWNFEFGRVERLAGNIGYLKFDAFMSPSLAGDTATAALTFLANSDALIFDLRQNGGGAPDMVAFISSYLVGSEPVHLNDFYDRPTNTTRASWTFPHVPGPRFADRDVYILTSRRTFSGAEEFAYNLKHLKRATIVGETTAGAGHTVVGRDINPRFAIAIPSGRPINPVTGTNWEGVGVEPDVKVPADKALEVAHLLALQRQQQMVGPDAPRLRSEVNTVIKLLRTTLGPIAGKLVAVDAVQPVIASAATDDFESGTLKNWRVDQRGAGGWFIYSQGNVAPDPTRSDPNFPFAVPVPPQGKFAAITDGNGTGRRILYRDVTLDGEYLLRLTMFYVNAGRFSAATASARNRISGEQQYRIDLVSPSAPPDSMVNNHILATVFESRPGDPPRREPREIEVNLSRWAGQTVRLRLSAADNHAPLRAGVDHVRFERLPR